MEFKIDTQQFDDQEMVHDALYSQKQISDSYNTSANECATPPIRDMFMNLLNEEHQIQFELFNEMNKRGWYPTQPADQQQVQQAKQKYQNMLAQQ